MIDEYNIFKSSVGGGVDLSVPIYILGANSSVVKNTQPAVSFQSYYLVNEQEVKPVSIIPATLELIDDGLKNAKSDEERALWTNGLGAFVSLLPK